MKFKTEQIEVSADPAQLIRKGAEIRGITSAWDDYLRALTETAHVIPSEEAMSEAEIEAIFDELAANGKDLPRLPDDFSRQRHLL
jgi:hypothetical protein